MSKVLVISKQQLKCNFCTNWFTTSLQFAKMQKHSLNICQSCLKDFNYQVIDSQTYQIYQLFIFNTGIKSNSNLYQLQQKYHQIVNGLMYSIPRSTQNKPILQYIKQLQKYNNSLSDLYSNISQSINQIKDQIFNVFKSHFDQISNNWIQQSKKLDLETKTVTDCQDKMLQTLKTIHYSQIIDKLKTLQLQNKITEISNQNQKLKQINQQSQFFKQIQQNIIWNNFKCTNCSNFNLKNTVNQNLKLNDIENKENINDLSAITIKKSEKSYQNTKSGKINSQKNMKALRQRCFENKNNAENQLQKIEKTNNMKSSKIFNNRQNNHSSKKLLLNPSQKIQNFIDRQSIKSSKSKKKSQNICFFQQSKYYSNHENQSKATKLQKDVNPFIIQEKIQLKKNQSQKNLFTFNGIDIQKSKNIDFDLQRQKVLSLIKNKIKFDSYLPYQVSKQQNYIDKQWGTKCMISAVIKLKRKTLINQDLCQLISKKISGIDFSAYLRSLQWKSSIKMVRMVKVGMTDPDFDILLHWLNTTAFNVNTLVITNNFLTEASLQGLVKFLTKNKNQLILNQNQLSSVYIGNNCIRASQGYKIVQTLKQQGVSIHL